MHGPSFQIDPVEDRIAQLPAEVQRGAGYQRSVVTLGLRAVDVLLDLAVGDPEAAEQRKVVGGNVVHFDLAPLQLQLVDRRDHAENAKGPGKELEELIVIHFGMEYGGVDDQAPIQIVALEAQLEPLFLTES